MKALSIREPYASLMLHGKIETRTWPTKYRGTVLICASKKILKWDAVEHISGLQTNNVFKALHLDERVYRHLGYAIAVGDLIESRPMTTSDDSACFVEYNPNLWCHVFEDVRPIKPIPWKGKLGYTNVPQEIINQIEYL